MKSSACFDVLTVYDIICICLMSDQQLTDNLCSPLHVAALIHEIL